MAAALLLQAGAGQAQTAPPAKTSPLAARRLVYASPFEEAALTSKAPASEKGYLAQLMAAGPGVGEPHLQKAQQVLTNLYAQIDATKPASKPLAKQVRTIFELAHQQFLTKYEDKATFDQTIEGGVYNCVSASALYALIFEHYQIPYAIKLKPTHVYVVADPQGGNIVVEGTDPKGGYFLPDARFKKAYVEFLTEHKLVSQAEVTKLGTEEIFKQKFQADKSIQLPQLISLQYYNQGVTALVEEDGERAYRALQKAEKLFPADETKYLVTQSLRQRLQGISYSKLEDVEILTDFYARQSADKYHDECLGDFRQLTQKFLLDKGDTATYRATYQAFQGSVADSATRANISYVYYMQQGRMQMLKQNNLGAFPLLMQAYEYNSTSPELQGLTMAVVHEENSRTNGGIRMLRHLELYAYEHPKQKGNPLLQKAYLQTYARATYDYFVQGKRPEGKRHLALFEQARTRKGAEIEAQTVASVYLSASIASLKDRDTASTGAYARKGLTFDPTNQQLRELARFK
ncbi:hypothetical protein AM218_05985 [Hymenobacter sp. DG25A]|nr:hypothetical protein AM218_05985 [Hymenobacter sp. DG25A]